MFSDARPSSAAARVGVAQKRKKEYQTHETDVDRCNSFCGNIWNVFVCRRQKSGVQFCYRATTDGAVPPHDGEPVSRLRWLFRNPSVSRWRNLMNNDGSSKRAFSGWFAMALAALLFASSGIAYAQKDKDRTTKPSPPPPAKSAPAPAPAAHSAPPASRPAPTSAPANPGRGTPTNQPGRPNVANQPGRPADANRPGPRPEFHGSNGSGARFGASGRPTVVHPPGATIVHAPSGARRIEVARPGGRVIVTNAAGHGYMQRPITVRGHAFVQRTYYVHGAAYPRFYRASVYRGITYNVYTPVRFYSPRFYAWGYSPWGAPVYYNFGFAGSPWAGFYAGYFSPYPSYAGPNYWLTDYLLANSLQEGYQERMDAAGAAQGGYDPSGQVALSPQVKDLIAGEVQRQLAQESVDSQNAAQNVMPASNGAPPILADNNPHVFVVSSSLIANTGSQECALTHGDVLQLNPSPSADPSFANVQVLASKGQDCQPGNLIPVQLADLQEMQNHMRETVDQGLGELQTRQGQGGLPTIEVAMRSQTAAPYAADLPPAEPNAANELRQQAQEADRQEQDVLGQAGPIAAPPTSAGPVTIEMGQSIADVVARMGNPVRIADLGQKKTYYYKDM